MPWGFSSFTSKASDAVGFIGGAVAPALETAGHATAGAAVAAADVATFGKVDGLGRVKDDQFKHMRNAAKDTEAGVARLRNVKLPFFHSDPEESHPDWMKDVSDETLVTELYLPGTHETMALHGGELAKCQDWRLDQQLRSGIRAMDIRVKHDGDNLPIYHGPIHQESDWDEVVRIVEDFLEHYPSEVVFMRVRKEGESGNHRRDFDGEVRSRLRNTNRWYDARTWDTLGHVRGKCIFVQHGSALALYAQTLDVQDAWQEADDSKKARIVRDHAHKPRNNNTLYLSYLSAAGSDHFCYKVPSALAIQMNKVLYDDWLGAGQGIYMMDYPGQGIIDRLIARNEVSQRRISRGINVDVPELILEDVSRETNPPHYRRSHSSCHGACPDGRLDAARSWAAATRQTGDWYEVDVGKPTLLRGVVVQRRRDCEQSVTKFRVSVDGVPVDGNRIFDGVRSADHCQTKKRVYFEGGVVGQRVRLHVVDFESWPSMRVGLLKDASSEFNPPGHQRSASSTYPHFNVSEGELNSHRAWAARSKSPGEWYEMDLGCDKYVVGVVMQARQDDRQWVTSCRFTIDGQPVDCGKAFEPFQNNEPYPGSRKARLLFSRPIRGRRVRVEVSAWVCHPSLRIGILEGSANISADITDAFRMWDSSGDGIISRAELKRVMSRLAPDMSDSNLDALLNSLDHNNDGALQYDEVVDWLLAER
mmetsp:Transcript_107519/g.302630  ORF Transcript_107519/g.302630 Transcript_107519/m.302630 type:complete len:703 (+) Transcript_107519:72-2180(+)